MPMNNKTKKQNRVRLNQNPFIAQSTYEEINRRKESEGLSLGRILDRAIEETKPADIKSNKDKHAIK